MESETIVLQLRQKDKGVNVYANGDYQISLDTELVLNPNDRIDVNSAYIDTTNYSSDQIIIDEDTVLSLDFVKYLNVYDILSRGDAWAYSSNNANAIVEENKDAVLCQIYKADPLFSLVETITFSKTDTRNEEWGGFVVDFVYQPVNVTPIVTTFFQISVPTLPPTQSTYVVSDINIAFFTSFGISIQAVFGLDPSTGQQVPKKLSNFFTVYDGFTSNVLTQNAIIPQVISRQIVLPKGRYNPNDLCELINKDMTQAEGIGNGDNGSQEVLIENGLVETAYIQTFITTTANVANLQKILITTNQFDDLGKVQAYVPTGNGASFSFIGTNQFSLEYNASTNRFEFSFLHFPIYKGGDSGGGEIVNQYKKILEKTGTTSGYNWCNRNGGVYFTRLSPAWFWNGHLGFSTDIIPTATFKTYDFGTTAYGTADLTKLGLCSIPCHNKGQGLIPGENITAGLLTIDDQIATTGNDWFRAVDAVPFISILDPPLTNGIIAGPSSLSFILDSGYFLLEINTGTITKIIGQNYLNNLIQGIVNRYYTINTYTASEGSNLEYIHNGEPCVLKTISCRILNPDGSLAVLGDDNTIFLKITKTVSPPVPPIQDTKKKT